MILKRTCFFGNVFFRFEVLFGGNDNGLFQIVQCRSTADKSLQLVKPFWKNKDTGNFLMYNEH
jgi:hypothetical protein